MPADQRGSVYATKSGFGIQYRDEKGARRRQAGFPSRSAARNWFQDVEKPRQRGEVAARPPVTLTEHVDRYLKVHASTRDPNTVRVLRERLRRPTATYGDERLHDLERMAGDIAEWRATLPERSAYGIMGAFRQCLDAAVRWGDMSKNPAKLAGANPPPPPRGVQTFTLAEIDLIAAELEPEVSEELSRRGIVPPPYGPMIRFAAATGMRPEEFVAIERQDIDRKAGVVRVARTHVEGRTKQYGKTSGSTREVPLSARALAALDDVVPRLDTRLVFPGPRGAHVNLRNFRKREWIPALEAVFGVCPINREHKMERVEGKNRMTCTARACDGSVTFKRIYDLRSTFASQALAAGVSVFELARIMGTSVRMIERHYGAMLQGSGEAIRGKLDAYDEATTIEAEASSDG